MKIYLAGPDVFLPEAEAMAAAKKQLCAAHGFEGVFPTDPRPDPAADAASARRPARAQLPKKIRRPPRRMSQ